MTKLTKVVLDVLKPHQPNSLDFADHIAQAGPDHDVHLTVEEMDEKTHTLKIVVTGADLDFALIEEAINDLGGSLHSIDEVQVCNG